MQQQYSMIHSIVDEKHRLVMLFTPKAGCTRAVIMMFKHMGLLDEARAYSPWVHDYRERCKFVIHPQSHLYSGDYFVFKVVRNPYDRVVSSFINAVEYCQWKYTNSNSDCPLLKNPTFVQFLELLDKTNFFTEGYVESHLYHHSGPQYVPGEEKYVRKYVRIENGQADVDEINRKCGTTLDIENVDPALLPHHQKRSLTTLVSDLGNVPFNQLPRPLPTSYSAFYADPRARALVERLFANDILRYGYSFYTQEQAQAQTRAAGAGICADTSASAGAGANAGTHDNTVHASKC